MNPNETAPLTADELAAIAERIRVWNDLHRVFIDNQVWLSEHGDALYSEIYTAHYDALDSARSQYCDLVWEFPPDVRRLLAEVEHLRQERDTLREALKPFADLWEDYDNHAPVDVSLVE